MTAIGTTTRSIWRVDALSRSLRTRYSSCVVCTEEADTKIFFVHYHRLTANVMTWTVANEAFMLNTSTHRLVWDSTKMTDTTADHTCWVSIIAVLQACKLRIAVRNIRHAVQTRYLRWAGRDCALKPAFKRRRRGRGGRSEGHCDGRHTGD